MTKPEEIVTWSGPGGIPRSGTHKQYMMENFPFYAALGLFTWEEVQQYLKDKNDA